MLVEFPISFSRGTNLRKRRTTISRTSPHAIIAVGKDKEGQERQRGTGQIRGKVKEDEIGIGIAGARSLSSEPGKGGGVANNRANPESRKFSTKKRDRRPAQNDKAGAKYRAGRSGEKPSRGILTDRSDSQIAEDPESVSTAQGC